MTVTEHWLKNLSKVKVHKVRYGILNMNITIA